MFRQNVLWNFEDLKLLKGTDLPIFGGDTCPCISLRLRSMSKPIRVLSGIDYWLDNLMVHVPEVTMCYHSNCFVQKHEVVMNEDLPSLNDPTCSPKVITCIAQNILSFLKSKATKPGHTYWLFKGNNDDIVKLYDLSSLYSESLVEEHGEGQHLFTIPVAMLLYRVARNLKYNSINETESNSATIQILLNNCLKLLNKTKYPHIVTSIYFMLCDFYIPIDINPASPEFEVFTLISPHVDSDENLSIGSDVEESIFSIGNNDLFLTHEKEKKPQKLKNPTSEIVMTLEERCQKALYNVGCGLSCLHYLKDINQQLTKTKGRKIKREKTIDNKGIKNKNRKHNKGSVISENDDTFENNKLLCKPVAEIISTWHNLPNPRNNFSWKQRLDILFYEKACLVYDILAENDLTNAKYGRALKHYCFLFKCWLCIINNNFNRQIGFILERSADCCLYISQNWDKVKQYTIELETDDKYDFKIRNSLLGKFDNCKRQDFNLIPRNIESKESMLKAAVNCYKRSLEFETNEKNKNKLNRRIGNVYCEIASGYVDEIANVSRKKIKISSSRLKWLLKTSKNCLAIGIDKFKSTSDLNNLALLYSNMGRLYRYTSFYLLQNKLSTTDFIKDKDFTKMAIESYTKGLTVLGKRQLNQQLWDLIFFDVSTMTYNMAIKYQDNPPELSGQIEAEKEVIDLLLKALKYCDLENDVSKKLYYEFRAADIHDRLASLYHYQLRCMKVDMPKFKITLHECTSHYNQSFEIFFKIKRPLECLEVLMKNIALDELQIENAKFAQSKVKFIMSIAQKLAENCVCVLQMLLENKLDDCKENNSTDNDNLYKPYQNSKDNQDREKKKLHLLKLLEDRLQQILKCMIKLSITKLPKLINKTEQLKNIYGELLRTSEANDNYSHLLRAVIQINDLSLYS